MLLGVLRLRRSLIIFGTPSWASAVTFAVIAIISTGTFAGAALYINLVEHPARMECGTEFAATIGAVLIGMVIPFTLLVIPPTNKRLLALTVDRSAAGTAQLLARWQRLHMVRTALSMIAFLVLVWSTLGFS
jgi:hypothetical protein